MNDLSKDPNNPRSSHVKIQSKYYLIVFPIGLFFALVFGPFAIVFFVTYMIAQFVFFNTLAATNGLIVKAINPKAHENIKKVGAHSFYDTLGKPLNTDSEAVRHAMPTLVCPNCRSSLYAPQPPRREALCCCGFCFCEGRWFFGQNNQWVPYEGDEEEEDEDELTYHAQENRVSNYWNGNTKRI